MAMKKREWVAVDEMDVWAVWSLERKGEVHVAYFAHVGLLVRGSGL